MFGFSNMIVFNAFAESSNHSVLSSPPEYYRLYPNILVCKDRWLSRNKYHRPQQGLMPSPHTCIQCTNSNCWSFSPFNHGWARNGRLATVDWQPPLLSKTAASLQVSSQWKGFCIYGSVIIVVAWLIKLFR